MNTTYIAKFEGGPLGGEERAMPWPPQMKIRVPARRSVSVFAGPSPGIWPMGAWDEEAYYNDRIYSEPYREPRVYTYRWENPNQSLLDKITKLEQQVAELSKANDLISALRVIKENL